LTLHLTKKLADKLKLSPSTESGVDALFSWRANYIEEDGFRFVVFMNDASGFTLVINEAKAPKLKKLPELFAQTLQNTFLTLGINSEVTERYISDLGEISYAKNSDRKQTARLNARVDEVWWGLRELSNDTDLSVYASSRPYDIPSSGGLLFPKENMFKLLERYELPVRKCRTFDLSVRLELDGNDAVRRLRIPANITFEQFHKLLQTAFEWRNCHLYNFKLLQPCGTTAIQLVKEDYEFDLAPNKRSIADVKLSDYMPEYKKILYTYDFGDNWCHDIELEQTIDDYEGELPILLSGEGDTPPEDVGGADGFSDFFKVIADPTHEDYEDICEWAHALRWNTFDFERVARYVKDCL